MRYISLSLLFMGSLAQAQGATSTSATKSDLFYQAAAGEVIFTPSIEVGSEIGNLADSQDDIEKTGSVMKMKFEAGFTENFSTAVELKYRNGNLLDPNQNNIKNKGLEDLQINLNANMPLERPSSSLHYGAFVRHSLDSVKETRVTASFNGAGVDFTPTESDPHTAGTSITPYIGYSEVVGPYVLGARVLQTVWGAERDTVTIFDGRESLPAPVQPAVPERLEQKEKGGGASELKVFAERNYGRLTLNVASKFRHYSPKKVVGTDEVIQDEVDTLSLEFYPSYKIQKDAEVIGGLSYEKVLNQNILYEGSKVTTGDITKMSVGGRFRF